MNNKILIPIAIVVLVLLSGCISEQSVSNTEIPAPNAPKYNVGDLITSQNTLLGGGVTSIYNGDYIFDDGTKMNITVADSKLVIGARHVPKYKEGDVIYIHNVFNRVIVRKLDLDAGYYISDNIVTNETSVMWSIISVDNEGGKIGNEIAPKFKNGDYIYSQSTLEYSKIINVSNKNETYITTKNKIDFLDDSYQKLDIHNPPNGLYLFKDEYTGLRYVCNEFANSCFYVVINMKTGEVTKVVERQTVYRDNSGSSKNQGHSDSDLLGAALIGGLIGHALA